MQSHRVKANGLVHHLLEWEGPSDRTVLILHGYLDMARSFQKVAAPIAQAGYRVIALDLRGYGESQWIPEGTYYYFPDYAADVALLLEALDCDRIHLVGHSMGGSVATLYAGTFPDRLQSLTLLEGVGLPPMDPDISPDRTLAWIEGLKRVRARSPKKLSSIDEATARMHRNHPTVPLEVIREVAAWSVRPVDDGFQFCFDPLHQTTSPGRFDAEGYESFIPRITCPVLLVDGGDVSNWPTLAERAARYPRAQHVSLEGAGHMMHWTQPDAVAWTLLEFLSEQQP